MQQSIESSHYNTMKILYSSKWNLSKNGSLTIAKEKIKKSGVLYVDDLEPYIERKLFSVNTGHATVAYTGALLGYQTIDEAMQDALVVAQLKSVLQETGSLLIAKWGLMQSSIMRILKNHSSLPKQKYL